MNAIKPWIGTVLGVTLIASVVLLIVFGIMSFENGRYAGMHYGEAKGDAIKAMEYRYGGVIASQLRLGTPDVVNTHLHNGDANFGTGQVRIFHFVGPKGARYCVPVSRGVDTHREAHAIVKGCKF